MTQIQLEEFLNNTPFQASEKEEILDANEKLKVYQERKFWNELNETKSASRKFHSYISDNSIFLRQDLKEKFMAIDDIMWDAITDKEFGHEIQDWKMQRQAFSQVKEKIESIKLEIELLVQKRLQLDQAV